MYLLLHPSQTSLLMNGEELAAISCPVFDSLILGHSRVLLWVGQEGVQTGSPDSKDC